MTLDELHQPDQIRQFLIQGLWLQRVLPPDPQNVRLILDWYAESASQGQPLLPIGFWADLGHLALGHDRSRRQTQPEIPEWPARLARQYEDRLLGKFETDWTFERASDALRAFKGRDQARGLAFVVKQFRERSQLGGVLMAPKPIQRLAEERGEDILRLGYDSLLQAGAMPLLVTQYEALIAAARRVGDVLGAEDLIALEQRTALADLGQYVAHRQILQQATALEAKLPTRPVRPLLGRREVPTRVLDEDQYPVGGYASLANRGSIESLLQSQLAYMEPGSEVGDLFDLKFVRDELFYYSRDENQFLRRRRVFVLVLDASLTAARFKDPELPTQRIVLVLASLLVLVRRLETWLSADALAFDLVLLQRSPVGPAPDRPDMTHFDRLEKLALGPEVELLTLLLQDSIRRGTTRVRFEQDEKSLGQSLAEASRQAQVQVLAIATEPISVFTPNVGLVQWVVNDPRPILIDSLGHRVDLESEDARDHWAAALVHLLGLWV